MKLWLLRPISEYPAWQPWYDKCFGLVIRANTEKAARTYASGSGGDECRRKDNPWLDDNQSSCVELTSEGDAGVVINDFRAA